MSASLLTSLRAAWALLLMAALAAWLPVRAAGVKRSRPAIAWSSPHALALTAGRDAEYERLRHRLDSYLLAPYRLRTLAPSCVRSTPTVPANFAREQGNQPEPGSRRVVTSRPPR